MDSAGQGKAGRDQGSTGGAVNDERSVFVFVPGPRLVEWAPLEVLTSESAGAKEKEGWSGVGRMVNLTG